jgi:hypothetical protein
MRKLLHVGVRECYVLWSLVTGFVTVTSGDQWWILPPCTSSFDTSTEVLLGTLSNTVMSITLGRADPNDLCPHPESGI